MMTSGSQIHSSQPGIALDKSLESPQTTLPVTFSEIDNGILVKKELCSSDSLIQAPKGESADFTVLPLKNENWPHFHEGSIPPGLLQTNITSDLSSKIKKEVDDNENYLQNPLHTSFEIIDEFPAQYPETERICQDMILPEITTTHADDLHPLITRETAETIDDSKYSLKSCAVMLHRLPSQSLKCETAFELGNYVQDSKDDVGGRFTLCDLSSLKGKACMSNLMQDRSGEPQHFSNDLMNSVTTKSRNTSVERTETMTTKVERSEGKKHKRRYYCATNTKKGSESTRINLHSAEIIQLNRNAISSSAALFGGKRPAGRKMTTNEGKKSFRCDTCSGRFISKSNLISHMIKYCGGKPFSCSYCSTFFTRKAHLETHVMWHTGKKPFTCSECLKSFSQKACLTVHMLTHSSEKPFRCSHCSASFARKHHLNTHIMTHTGEKPFRCSECSKSFISTSHLKRHMLTHSGEKPFSCSHCSISFANKFYLKNHFIKHTGEKPFPCSECSKYFIHKAHLTMHMRTHSGEKPFICSHCSIAFATKDNLKNHIFTHTGEKPFRCSECSKSFIQITRLKMHMRTQHSGEKPFNCGHCSTSFARKVHLRWHIMTHIREEAVLLQ